MASTDLYDACFDLLVAAAEAVGTTPGGAIDRAYVSPGPPAWDCEQLTVHAGGPAVGDTAPLQPPLQPGHRVAGTGMVNIVEMTVTVLRCCTPVPTSEGEGIIIPSAQGIAEAAELSLADLWAIWNHVATRKRNGTLFPPAKTREMFFDPAVALNTQGGCSGWQIQMRVQLDGYEAP